LLHLFILSACPGRLLDLDLCPDPGPIVGPDPIVKTEEDHIQPFPVILRLYIVDPTDYIYILEDLTLDPVDLVRYLHCPFPPRTITAYLLDIPPIGYLLSLTGPLLQDYLTLLL